MKIHVWKNLRRIQPTLILIVPRTCHTAKNIPLFVFLFQSRLFFQKKVVWVWESELREDLAKLRVLEGRWWGRKASPVRVTCGIRAEVALSEERMLWTKLCCGTADVGMPAGTVMLCWQGLCLKPKSYFSICSRQGCDCQAAGSWPPSRYPRREQFANTAATWGCHLLWHRFLEIPPAQPQQQHFQEHPLCLPHAEPESPFCLWIPEDWTGASNLTTQLC